MTSGYGLLQDIAQDVTNFFGATASTDYAAAQESDLLNALRLNYVWLFYAYPLIKSLAIDAELLVPGGPGLAASGGEPSTSYYEDLVFNQRIGTSTETADMLFGNQFGSTVFSGFQEYIEAFCALIYRIKIHNAILAYEQRLMQQVLHGDVTDVVNGEEYAGNVDDAERLQIFKDILRTQEGQSITSEENARLKRLAEQCFLTDFIEEFSKLNQERAENYLTFTPVQGRTDTLVNKLIFDPALACMDKLTPAELSSLVPKIRLYKVLFDVADDQEGGLLQTY